MLMIKAQLGLGVLSLPFVLSTLGMVPGILCIIAVGIIMSWGEWMIGEFKLSHPEVCEYTACLPSFQPSAHC